MNTEGLRDYPWRWKRKVFADPIQVYEAFAQAVVRARYRLVVPGPHGAASARSSPNHFEARRDIAPDAQRRRLGKVMLGVGVIATTVLMIMMAEGIATSRASTSLPLLLAVIIGGIGMNRLRDPEGRTRKLLEVEIISEQDGAIVRAWGGAGLPLGDDGVEGWCEIQDFAREEVALEGVVAALQAGSSLEGHE